jgi:murein DD-endopeptidase MepM/ murein hydrolase activator NlpD
MIGLRTLVAAAAIGSLMPLITAADPPRPAALPGWSWPLRPVPDRVVRDFDPPAQPWLPGNRGVDLAGHAGERVHAAGSGVVSFAGTIAHLGVVAVTSGALRTTYEPLRVTVHRGQRVAAGAVLGVLSLGGSHCLPAACLHWGLLRADSAGAWSYLDPLALLGEEQVRLLPLS